VLHAVVGRGDAVAEGLVLLVVAGAVVVGLVRLVVADLGDAVAAAVAVSLVLLVYLVRLRPRKRVGMSTTVNTIAVLRGD
jgi:Flp pilus assembly protein TadB